MSDIKCHDCDRPYGDEHGFPDLVVPKDVWKKISPTKNEGGMLCPSCICKRLYDASIECKAEFRSGPLCNAMEKTSIKPIYPFVTFPNYDEEASENIKGAMQEGNIPAFLHIILHNQGVLNYKLTKIIKKMDA